MTNTFVDPTTTIDPITLTMTEEERHKWAEAKRAENYKKFREEYLRNEAPETSIRKTIKPGRELLEYAKQHCEPKDYHLKNGGYGPSDGFKLKQDISDVICYYIEDKQQLVPKRVVEDYEWLLDRLDENDLFHSRDENEINKFRRLYDRYHKNPRIPDSYRREFDSIKLTTYSATRLGRDYKQIEDKFGKYNWYHPKQLVEKLWLQ